MYYVVTFLCGTLASIPAGNKIGEDKVAGIALVILVGIGIGEWVRRDSGKSKSVPK